MPITFGSVGDIISLSLLIKDLVKCLDESRGSSKEYQAVIRELWSLDHALLEVELLLRSCKQSAELNDLCKTAKCCAEQCRECIEEFRDKTKKYQSALQGGGTRNLVKDTTAKIRWHVSEKDDLAAFRAVITAHTSSLNILLATAGVKLAILNDEGMHKRLQQSDVAYASSSATQTSLLVDLINTRFEETKSTIQAVMSETMALGSRIKLDNFRNVGAEVLSFLHKMWRINFMTYNAVLSLQARIPAQLDRMWTQDPVMLEDALGRVTPFHLEFIDSWEVFQSVLEVRFRQLPGYRKIKQKEYALQAKITNEDVEISKTFNRCFLPGQQYDMSMIFNAALVSKKSCPACSIHNEEASDERVKCKGCGLWYQRIVETVADAAPGATNTPAPSQRPSLKRGREEGSENEDEPRQFRRVRLRCRQQARKQSRIHEAEFETLISGTQIIRCICGAQNDNSSYALSARPIGTWLIQCGNCKAWQHRSCVGTANGSDPLGGYYCERCPPQRTQVPRTSPPGTPAVPEYLPLERPSNPERSSTSSHTPPANETNVSKKGSMYTLGEGSAGKEDSSFDEEMPDQPKKSLNRSFDKRKKMFRSRPPPPPPPRFWRCGHCGESLNSVRFNMYCTNPNCGKRKDAYSMFYG